MKTASIDHAAASGGKGEFDAAATVPHRTLSHCIFEAIHDFHIQAKIGSLEELILDLFDVAGVDSDEGRNTARTGEQRLYWGELLSRMKTNCRIMY